MTNSSADDTPSSDYTFMPTVSVVVNKSYKTHALLDSDSTNSFITSNAVTTVTQRKAHIQYKKQNLLMQLPIHIVLDESSHTVPVNGLLQIT